MIIYIYIILYKYDIARQRNGDTKFQVFTLIMKHFLVLATSCKVCTGAYKAIFLMCDIVLV